MPEGPLGLPRLTNIGPFVEEEVTSNTRLIQGNSIEILSEFVDEQRLDTVDAVITDPPYGIDIESFDMVQGKIAGDSDVEQALGVFRSTMDQTNELLVDGGPVLSFAGDQTLCEFMQRYVKEAYDVQQVLVWDKMRSGPPFGSPWWRYSYELIIHASNGVPTYENRNAVDTDVLKFESISPNQSLSKRHPTEKPLELMEYLIESVTRRGEVVLDPFMGSGTTGVAAKNTGRDFIGIEIDPGFFNIAKERINNA